MVGPRPERPVYIEDFKDKIPHYMLRHKVPAGITGWAQVHGWRGDTSIDKRIEFDLYYQPINGRWRLAGIAVEAVDVLPDAGSGDGAASQ